MPAQYNFGIFIMGIEGKCSSISFLYSTAVFTFNLCCNFIGICFYPPFWRPKGCKRRSTDKISRSALLLTNFRKRKYPSAGRYLSATFPTERLRGSVKVKPRIRRAKKTFTLLSAPFLRPLPVILTVLYFF